MEWSVAAGGMFLLVAAFHGLIRRAPWRPNIVTSFVVFGMLGAIGLALVEYSTLGMSIQALAGMLIYALVCEVYIFLFTLVGSSISVRLITTLHARDLTYAEVDELYDSAGMVDARIVNLLRNGFLIRSGDALVVTAKGHGLLATFYRLGTFFRHPAYARETEGY